MEKREAGNGGASRGALASKGRKAPHPSLVFSSAAMLHLTIGHLQQARTTWLLLYRICILIGSLLAGEGGKRWPVIASLPLRPAGPIETRFLFSFEVIFQDFGKLWWIAFP
ncbi:hypothetical protein VTN77DRAFT_4640 [Rasamsonia byssochlamydoides]|uniref:uncharacterized protein n=1 Tax=Rasamsonia byssochlamydoides TaxID=89139 RepID=UPI00374214B7